MSSNSAVHNCKVFCQHCEAQPKESFFFSSERPNEGTQSRVTNTGELPGKTEGCLWSLLVGTWRRHEQNCILLLALLCNLIKSPQLYDSLSIATFCIYFLLFIASPLQERPSITLSWYSSQENWAITALAASSVARNFHDNKFLKVGENPVFLTQSGIILKTQRGKTSFGYYFHFFK